MMCSVVLLIHRFINRKMKSAARNSQELILLAAELAQLSSWRYHQETGLFEFNDTFYAVYATNTAAECAFLTSPEYVRRFVYPEERGII